MDSNDANKKTELINLRKAQEEPESPAINEDVEKMAEGAIEIGTKQMEPMQIQVDIEKGDDEGEGSGNSTGDSDDEDINDVDQTFIQRIKSVLKNPYFLLLCISLTGLYYIITGI